MAYIAILNLKRILFTIKEANELYPTTKIVFNLSVTIYKLQSFTTQTVSLPFNKRYNNIYFYKPIVINSIFHGY